MRDAADRTRSITVERDIPHPPEKIWRALTQPHLIEEWLMKNEFRPVVGHRFNLRAEWGVVDCEVRQVEEHRTLAYSWGDHDLKSVVTWTLIPTDTGTKLRMEQTGFRPRPAPLLWRRARRLAAHSGQTRTGRVAAGHGHRRRYPMNWNKWIRQAIGGCRSSSR